MSRDCPSRSALRCHNYYGLCRLLAPAHQPSPFQAQGKISPGKNAILPRTIAAFTSPGFDHNGFAAHCLLALPDSASDAVRVPRLADLLRASSPRLVTLTQLHFASLAVVSSREDLHLQDRAHAGRTTKTPPRGGVVVSGGEGGIRTHVGLLNPHPISSRRRYDRFGTSPRGPRIL